MRSETRPLLAGMRAGRTAQRRPFERNPETTLPIGVGAFHLSDRAKELVLEALDNERLSYGPMTRRFESEFARLHGSRFAVMSNSGTSSLQVSLQAMKELHGWEDGDEVVVPSITFVATVNIVLHNRMRPVLVDVDPLYYEMNPELLESVVTPKTRAVIPVHLFGHPADMDPIREIAHRHRLRIIEDSCETMFASYRGRSVGSLGEIGCFSTYMAHLLVTGVGGMSTTSDPELAIRLRSLINHGRDSIYLSIDDDDGRSPEQLKTIVAKRFQFVSAGHSFRSTEMEAALGLAQIEEHPSNIAARRANAKGLAQRLAHLESHLQLPQIRPGCDHSFMMFPVVLRQGQKEALCNFLEQNGVETRDMFPLTSQPLYQRLLGWREDAYPVAQGINRNGFYIGCHQNLTELELDYVAGLLDSYIRRAPARTSRGACLVLLTQNRRPVVERTLEEIPGDLFRKILCVDGHSTDGTVELLHEKGIPVIDARGDALPALHRERELLSDCESLVLFSADGRHDPKEIGRLLLALERGNDMVIASRLLPGGNRYAQDLRRTPLRSAGNRLYTLLANLLFCGNLSDTLSTLRAVRAPLLAGSGLDEKGLGGFYQLSIRSMRRRWRVAEIPCREVVTVRLRDWVRIGLDCFALLRILLKEWWLSKRQAREDGFC